jgi:hypothetical protein
MTDARSGVSARSIGRFRCYDATPAFERPTERRFDEGNRQYVMTVPTGVYEAEEAGEEMRINRVDASSGADPQFVCSLPAGTYEIDADDAGSHIYRVPDDEHVRIPIAQIADRMPAALSEVQKRINKFWDR